MKVKVKKLSKELERKRKKEQKSPSDSSGRNVTSQRAQTAQASWSNEA